MLKRKRLLAIGVLAAIGATLLWSLWPQRWELQAGGRSGCEASEGATREAVLARCGDPDATGTQPKRLGGNQGLISLCSAPCDRYSDQLLFLRL